MKKPNPAAQDDFFKDAEENEANFGDSFVQLADHLEPATPSTDLEARILAALPEQRFERFSKDVTELLDISEENALQLLNGIDESANWSEGPVPGMTLYHVEGGPKVERAITGFTKIIAGGGFPEHKHLGIEHVLVIQGYFIDDVSGEKYGPGDLVVMEPNTRHSFRVLENGPDLTYLVVVQEGIELNGAEIKYDSPLL